MGLARSGMWIGLLLLVVSPVRGDELSDQIACVIDAADYKAGHWGLLVCDAETGDVLFARNPDRLFLPASTTKLYSCTAALAGLGADHRFETPVYRRGEVKGGTLRGDLILVAKGDLTLGGRSADGEKMAFMDGDHIYSWGGKSKLTTTDPLAGLRDLARGVVEAGIRSVEGEVLIDDRLFEKARGSGSGPDLVTPILVNDNLIDLTIEPARKAGEPARVTVRPESRFYQLDIDIRTEKKGQPTQLTVERAGPSRISVRGRVPAGMAPLVRSVAVDDPRAFARGLFIECLREVGVRVRANPWQPDDTQLPDTDQYDKLPRVAVHRSLPLSEVVKVTLKVSHNLYASTFPMLLAVKEGKRTLADGLRVQGELLKELGLDIATVSFGGGAGGSNADSVTPRTTVALLRAVAKQPYGPALRAGLPVLGVDGTLADVVSHDSPARGKVFAKTGTLSWHDGLNDRTLLRSKALAGYLTTAKGRELVFAMFVNDVPLPRGVETSREGKALGRVCEIIYQHAP